MNKLHFSILLILIVGLLMNSCQKDSGTDPKPVPDPVRVTSVTLNTTSLVLTEGDTQEIVATVSPSNADNKKILWTTSSSSVASVQDGRVTAVKQGKATITATTDDGGKTATCAVEVIAKIVSVTGVSLDKTEIELTEDETANLNATVLPDNATNKNVVWSSDNETVAKVKDGKVTAVKAGTATITVKTDDGGKTANCKITVNKKSNIEDPEDGGKIDW